MTTKKAVEKLSFEEALAELESLVGTLEDGGANLDSAIAAYQRGVALKTHCEKKLKEAQAKIEKITVGPDGTVSTAPLDVDN